MLTGGNLARVLVILLALGIAGSNSSFAAGSDADDDAAGNDHQTKVAAETKQKTAPKDYSYSPKASRVKDLAGFFESMQRRNLDPNSDEKQSLVISLSEAANKLHLLMDGLPLEIKCNRYVKLIDRPNIRTFATVNLLANEDKQFNEIEQNDVNLMSRLQNERSFDALSKSQTIMQSLESERNNMRSAYDAEVQIELLNCINYYIYRHQRATLGLIEYVRGAKAKLDQYAAPSGSKIVLERYHEILEAIKSIEAGEGQQNAKTDGSLAWLREFAKLYDLMLENGFELPKLVQDFVTEPKRLERLRAFDGVLSKVEEVEASILQHEANQTSESELEKNQDYRRLLVELSDMVEKFGDLLQEDTRKLVGDPNRRRLIEGEIESMRLNQVNEEAKSNSKPSDSIDSETNLKNEEEVDSANIPDQISSAGQELSKSEVDDMDEEKFMELLEVATRTTTDQSKEANQQAEEEKKPAKEQDFLESSHTIACNVKAPPSRDLKREAVGLAGKYITGFNMKQGSSNDQTDDSVDHLMPKSACTEHAFELSANLRLYDDTGIEFDWAKSMAKSVSNFMVNCLMRSSYLAR